MEWTAAMFSGIADEITSAAPVVIPVAIGVLAIRKGISFVFGIIRSA